MKKFLIFFEEKEGSTPLVEILNNFEQVSIVHSESEDGRLKFWEPFERHHCGLMKIQAMTTCLMHIFDDQSCNMQTLNQVYSQTGKRELVSMHGAAAVGLKKRPVPPFQQVPPALDRRPLLKYLQFLIGELQKKEFKRQLTHVFREKDVTVFVLVRQDLLRWALSKYHGDGSGRPGHLQFKLARGVITKEQIGKITVDCNRLGRIIRRCQRSHQEKRELIQNLQQSGVEVFPLFYEDFLNDKQSYFKLFFDRLNLPVSSSDIDAAILKGGIFKKVHSDNISEFVENHEEVLDKFGNLSMDWKANF